MKPIDVSTPEAVDPRAILVELRKEGLPTTPEIRTPGDITNGYFREVAALIGILHEAPSAEQIWRETALKVYNLLRLEHGMLDRLVLSHIDHTNFPKTSYFLEFCLGRAQAA